MSYQSIREAMAIFRCFPSHPSSGWVWWRWLPRDSRPSPLSKGPQRWWPASAWEKAVWKREGDRVERAMNWNTYFTERISCCKISIDTGLWCNCVLSLSFLGYCLLLLSFNPWLAVPAQFSNTLRTFASDGFRVLALGYKTLHGQTDLSTIER